MHDLYLFYGATFFGAGVALAFQARLPRTILPKGALWFLAGFGLVHGLSEWAQMEVVAAWGLHDRDDLRLAGLLLGVASFALLAQFAILVLGASRRRMGWLLALVPFVAITWSVLMLDALLGDGIDLTLLTSLEVVSRYLFGLPASLLAAWALWTLRTSHGKRVGRFLAGGSIAFVVYALASVIGPAAPFFPASYVSSETFWAVAHFPIEFVRMACAVAIVMFVSEAFVVEAAKERQELSARREEFISIVAHDLRSPIAVIGLGAELIEQQLDAHAVDSRAIRRSLQSIIRSAQGLERMVRDLLDASRIETQMLALEPRPMDLGPLIVDIVGRASGVVLGHSVRVVIPDRVPQVDADAMRVEQVLFNLLSNAAKYSSADSEIGLEVKVLPREVEVAVTNEGRGLSATEIENVFSRFYRSKEHAGKVEGLGIGLYIAKGLVEAQGGRIWCDSEPGRLTTFHFTLARTDAAREVKDAAADDDRPAKRHLTTAHA
ncbi:MAG TPA: ATP-binding protein [Kofleriaceae bacterium]|nr:ATP-binding protein [Kofleriaceae bacterium]